MTVDIYTNLQGYLGDSRYRDISVRVRVVPKLLRHRHRPRLQAEGGCGELALDCVVYDNQIWVHSYPVTKITKDKTYIICTAPLLC